jgi:hypothetical protein
LDSDHGIVNRVSGCINDSTGKRGSITRRWEKENDKEDQEDPAQRISQAGLAGSIVLWIGVHAILPAIC